MKWIVYYQHDRDDYGFNIFDSEEKALEFYLESMRRYRRYKSGYDGSYIVMVKGNIVLERDSSTENSK
jgi:hypothetical protein